MYKSLSGLYYPLGILYIAAILRKHGYKISFVDLTFGNFHDIKKELLSTDIIGISAASALFGSASKVANYIKEIDQDLTCIIGGPHATAFPQDCLEKGFDIAVIGEGERTIIDLLNAIEKNKPLQDVAGIVFRKSDNLIYTRPRALIPNLDELPFPARDLIDHKRYFASGVEHTLIASRGCPYNCIYCKPMIDKLFGRRVRMRSPFNVIDELEMLCKDYKHEVKARGVVFVDDVFTINRKWIESFCAEIKKRKLEVRWSCQTRVNLADEKVFRMMKSAGCYLIEFGVESGSQRI
jgi:anaerobic magnesium-protoporphyrin IX monomethyl ester cyclase